MNFISRPNPRDVVLDPFAGHGTIPLERVKSFPFKEIIAVDKDDYLVFKLKQKLKVFSGKRIIVTRGDALNLKEIQNNSIDKIISDPPWGEYKEIPNLEKFYEAKLKEFSRILKPDCIIILLIGAKVGAKGFFENVLQNKFAKTFCLKRRYDILLSGKKAAIYQIVKSHGNK